MFIFEKKVAEKLHKPRRKETITELLKGSVKTLERFRHPRVSVYCTNIYLPQKSWQKIAVSVEHTGSFLSIENGRQIFAENQCKGNRFDTSTKQKSLELLKYTIILDIFP